MIDNFTWCMIYQIDGSGKGIIPEFLKHRGLSKEGEINFDYVSMFSFS
jgi:hypothetical protein